MRTILGLSLGLTLIAFATATPAQTPAHVWSQRFGSTSTDIAYAVAVDVSGNVLVTGFFSGTVNFGGSDLMSVGSFDIFLAKYNASGVHQWSKRFGNTLADQGLAVAVDASGNVVVTGNFQGTVNFGGTDLLSVGSSDVFVAKFNANGLHQWSKRFGNLLTDTGNAIAVDVSGNVVVTGYFQDTVNFGGVDLVSAGSLDIFLAKYNASGAHQWSKSFGNTGSDATHAVAVDASGNVAITGSIFGTVDFGGGGLVGPGTDSFLAKYNAGGVHQWSQRFAGVSTDVGRGVAMDGSGNVVVTGYTLGTIDFGGGILVGAGSDAFLAKYDASGAHLWSRLIGGGGGEIGYAVAVDASANVVVTGYFQTTVDFGGGNRVSAGANDVFLAKYDASGAHQWSGGFGSTLNDEGHGVAVDGSGNVIVTGEYFFTVNFGGGGLVSAGERDIFLAKYASLPQEPVITSIADIGNDQGRHVKIRFANSAFDGDNSPNTIVQYVAFRRDDAPPSSSTLGSDGLGLSQRELLDLGWTQAGTVLAFEQPSYGIDVATVGDSTEALGQYYSVFFVRAATAAPGTYFDSPIDSGYSIDNLAPGVPAAFAYNAGMLSWNESPAADFDYFSVYGAMTNSFGAAALVDYTTGISLDVSGAAYVYYFVTATDFSGNEGSPAVINAPTGAGGTPKNHVLSISAYPNPFNPQTTVRYTLPARGRVTIAVYDLRGALVATLVDDEMDAGAYTIGWNGRDDRGTAVGSGVYFARLTSPAGTRSYKMTLLK